MLNVAILCLTLPMSAPGDDSKVKFALVNMKCVYSDSADAKANQANIQANLDRHRHFVDHCAGKGAGFVGFPELSVSGYHFSKDMTWLKLDGPEAKAIGEMAVAKKVYVAAGFAMEADGKRWNMHVVFDPQGQIVAKHKKLHLTKEKGFTEAGTEHTVFDMQGLKIGIATCADGSFKENLQGLVKNGATVIYGPHANTTGGTVAGWYKFRDPWSGPNGWIAEFKVHALIHNNAGLFGNVIDAPTNRDANSGWASGAWHIGPDGKTISQMPTSSTKADSKEYVLFGDVPIRGK